MTATMATGLDEQHATYDRRQRENLASIGLDGRHAVDNHQPISSSELSML